ncbi:2Fe-2S iron-sulfur cluster binding domain-containing protein [Verticiella sediminum]|uniref:2Fe-2S iron-sulfur cluster binding domain-containing protein n=1 Tax=Verticiella sediminum TaxID=1247510 RepID=A0A556AU23_9BURK|nr:2Fe-2S iron-sulfur cluster-binding protein [Verticiella sediminum]TSH96406.1 2Fe-2S iron-sulfur cluster binding domain-containing protein [Verticiella sediminum]
MPTVNFIAYSGERHAVQVPPDTVLMRAAVDNGVPGIDGDCGGQCACATCHVYIEAPWAGQLPAMSEFENDMLGLASERRDSSRLACQIPVTPALDGIEVRLPEGQH